MKKIAVMLPAPYRGGSLRAAKHIAKAIAYQARERSEQVQVVFSYVGEAGYDLVEEFGDLREYGIELRETRWVIYPRAALQGAIDLCHLDPRLVTAPQYCLPEDGANDFYDCDLWVLISDRVPAPMLPIRRYVCFIYDYIQRYDPKIWLNDDAVWGHQTESLFSLVRNAARVFVSTPSTGGDIVAYAGVERARVQLLDMDFEPVLSQNTNIPDPHLPRDYFIWTTNATHHKNHVKALDALEIYFQELGGKLNVLITGNATEYLDPANEFAARDAIMLTPQVQYVRNKLLSSNMLNDKVHILGNMPDRAYSRVLRNAAFLWHPALYDNGTFSAIEAAYVGVPTLSARYPAQEYIDKEFGLNMRFFDPNNAREMAEALLTMETQAAEIQLPARESLLRHDWKEDSPALYQAVSELAW